MSGIFDPAIFDPAIFDTGSRGGGGNSRHLGGAAHPTAPANKRVKRPGLPEAYARAEALAEARTQPPTLAAPSETLAGPPAPIAATPAELGAALAETRETARHALRKREADDLTTLLALSI